MNCKLLLNLCLTAIVFSLTGCASSFPGTHNTTVGKPESKYICQRLKTDISVTSGNNINRPNDNPIQQAKLYRQYEYYNCDQVLAQ